MPVSAAAGFPVRPIPGPGGGVLGAAFGRPTPGSGGAPLRATAFAGLPPVFPIRPVPGPGGAVAGHGESGATGQV